MRRMEVRSAVLTLCLALAVSPWGGPALALALGTGCALFLDNPWPQRTASLSRITLQLSVVGLGLGLKLGEVVQTGRDSLGYTAVGISFALGVGYLLGRMFGTERNTSALISAGTAICGGSAIAALAPVLDARDDETAVALGTVFTLNSLALLLFPLIGHLLELRQDVFGTWAGLAIHDTSSVVGAASAFGEEALKVGTTVKLTRAVWIVPVVFGAALMKKSDKKVGIPLFIIGFIAAAAVRTLFPAFEAQWNQVAAFARHGLGVSLFFVGLGLSREVLGKVGVRPMLQGVTLWLVVSGATLAALLASAGR